MSPSDTELEAVVLESLLPTLEAEGFRVLLHPSSKFLPAFMRTHQPDAIAVKQDRKVAIEVMSDAPGAGARLRRMQEVFSGHPEWEFRVVYAPSRAAEAAIPTPARTVLEDVLDRLPKVLEDGGPVPAVLTAWSAFEAAARSLAPADVARPQPPARLVEILASDGYLTPLEADHVRRFADLRNKAAHGDFNVVLTPSDLRKFVRIVRALLDQLPETASAS
jgi:hypothetical protein